MLTQLSPYNKALVVVIMGVLQYLNSVWHIHIGLTEETVTTIIIVLTPLLAYLVPNKPKV